MDDYPHSVSTDALLSLLESEDQRDRIVAKGELSRRGLLPKTKWQKVRPWLFQAAWLGVVAYVVYRWR